jgi:hypothetical protein
MNPAYLESVRLLLAVAPEVLAGGGFALKGGTAINLFHRNLPRLSVDLDLVFVNHQPQREEALDAITRHLAAARVSLENLGLVCDHAGVTAGEVNGVKPRISTNSESLTPGSPACPWRGVGGVR